MFRRFGNISLPSWAVFKRLPPHPWIISGLGSVALLGMVTASAIVSHTNSDLGPVHAQTLLEPLTPQAALLPDIDEFVHEERIQRSDTLASLLSRLGIKDTEAMAYISRNSEADTIARQLRPGKTVTAKTLRNGRLTALYFPINGRDAMLVVKRKDDGQFSASEQAISLLTQIHLNSGEISSSLYGATDEAGIPDAIASQLAEIFSSDIDFHRDLRKGDKFSIVFETQAHNGRYFRSGRILAAEFVNGSRSYQAYWFETGEGKGSYYAGDGKSLRKAFLRSPLEFSRITSGFSIARRHPVLHVIRAHRGVDYGAPIGTRVRAVADGVVEFAGRQGGYGNLIILRHQSRYSTAYGHLNGFAPEIRRGARVSQNDTIGFVGQTGLATGPHLHYEFRVNGQQVNPMAVTLPDAIPLNSAQLSRFRTAIEPLRAHLDLVKQVRTASID